MKGLVLVKFKKDVLSELPDIIYRIIECKPNQATLNAAKLITKTAKTAIEALTLQRELSDGFQYKTKIVGKEVCPLCLGGRITKIPSKVEIVCARCQAPNGMCNCNILCIERIIPEEEIACDKCKGIGEVNKEERTTVQIVSPKEEIIRDLLDEFEDVGRVIIFAGFTGSIEKIINLVKTCGWNWIRVDGSGWKTDLFETKNSQDMLTLFQEKQELFPKIAFVIQPRSGGMALTLTASPVEIFYSNDFDGDARLQAKHRAHRPGMDLNRGLTVIDIFHLPTDKLVYDNLEKKLDMQAITLGDLSKCLDSDLEEPRLI